MRTLWTWIKANTFVLALGIIFSLLTIPWLLPPHFSSFEWQQRLQAWQHLMGLVCLPLGICLVPFSLTKDSSLPIYTIGLLLTLLLAGVLGWSVGYAIRYGIRRIRHQWFSWASLVIVAVVGFNMFCGISMYGAGLELDSLSHECFISETDGVRLIHYRQRTIYDYDRDRLFILTTNDGGLQWQQCYITQKTIWLDAFCANLTWSEAGHIWTWTRNAVYFSFDGMQTWLKRTPLDWDEGPIESMTIEVVGGEVVAVIQHNDTTTTFVSPDGGHAWWRIFDKASP